MSFNEFPLRAELLESLARMSFSAPTSIQSQAIGPALDGRDLLACAATGSGKTVAFLLPVLQQLLEGPRGQTRALVLSPTRELVAQTLEAAQSLAGRTRLRAAAIMGGVGMGRQAQALRNGVELLVATPGRLLDHLQDPRVRLDGLEYLVLDEADRMLDMGFLPDIRRILGHLPAKRQTLFFSATLPPAIARLSRELLHEPATIDIERPAAPAAGVSQSVYPVSQVLKPALLHALLASGQLHDTLVFTRTKHRADRLARYLSKQGVACERIHGDRSQAQRTAALAGFRRGRYQVLVATDIAARGIDVTALGHVVNFDLPAATEDYIHRVGRTARASATGEALSFVSPEEEAGLRAIEKALRTRLPRLQLADFDYGAKPAGAPAPAPAAGRARPGAGRARRRREAGAPRPGAPETAAERPVKGAGTERRRAAGERPARRARRPGAASRRGAAPAGR